MVKTLYKKPFLVLSVVAVIASSYSYAQYDPKPVFKGSVGKTVANTKLWNADRIKAPQDAPNVVWILIDDVGFGASSAFGGLINTPTFDSLANNGLRYTNFHTTAICAPTRAALLTGRNSHSVGMGLFTETAIGTPGYNGRIPFEDGTAAEVFKENGYNTFAVGKWHLTPVDESTPAGPFTRWPTGRGFDRWYGFLGGETDEWHPQLWDGIQKLDIEPNTKHLNELLADKAISYIAAQKSVAPDKPFFLYIAPGATHAPHQVAKEWIDKYKGRFDMGWDEYRRQVFAQQQKMGLLPAGTKLAPRNSNIKAWDSLTADEKKLFAHFMEVYAGFLSYTDYEVGRVVSYLQQIGQLDNTMIAVMIGDNGASKEGTDVGTTIGLSAIYQGAQDESTLLNQIDSLGSEYSSPNYPLGWALAANAPFHYWKSDANSEGGTHNPLILFYPKCIKDKGGIRKQYSHIIDVLPTSVELAGIKIPQTINGYQQEPVQGVSLAYTISNATAASKHTEQYYEIMGSRSIYKNGWKAGTFHVTGNDFDKDTWELYHLDEDWTETNNLASQFPEKLTELKAQFDSDAKKYNIYPLKDRTSSSRSFAGLNDTKKTVVLYPGATQYWSPSSPRINAGSFSVTAETEIADNRAEGVLLANGGRFSGITLYLKDSKLHFFFNDGYQKVSLVADKPITAGKNVFKIDYAADAGTPSKGGEFTLSINDAKVASQHVNIRNGILYYTYDEGLDIGKDSNTPVDDSYKVPNAFTGTLNKVIVESR